MPVKLIPNKLARELADIDSGTVLQREENPLWAPFAAECFSYGITEVVLNKATDIEKRWSRVVELILKDKDKNLWRAYYETGLTERQDYTPFEYMPDEVEFDQVEAHEVTRTEYRNVK